MSAYGCGIFTCLELRARGFLTGRTVAGQQAEIETVAGRRLAGLLVKVNLAYTHGFGPPVAPARVLEMVRKTNARAVLISTIVTHSDIHRQHMRELDALARQLNMREDLLIIAGKIYSLQNTEPKRIPKKIDDRPAGISRPSTGGYCITM